MNEKEKNFVKNYSMSPEQFRKILDQEPQDSTVAAMKKFHEEFRKRYPHLIKLWKTL